MREYQIKSLKELIKAYGNHKSDLEISQLLDIPLEKVSEERRELQSQSK